MSAEKSVSLQPKRLLVFGNYIVNPSNSVTYECNRNGKKNL